ncbi:SDR family NAD(P)-dependent oxidoreductase [Leptolyngbyaceae cyanobacterium CCMR0082]|uniref:SDR family NAD(P)-dependent oxidoreductase n=1 Tax=Adonisia turfae CCMR0082 TaxID=2304604 RepID=A0A6M0SBB5_9CYAN|nr:type I polyketide synthase [Adonisia turfae]NEZ64962.1 SDR family NAD(P)-dependent oxidoreductase [Adonisia turfae CCMR0082]
MVQQNHDNFNPDARDISADIAIVSMAGQFPGAPDVASFWQNLQAGVESISQFSDQELLQAGVDPALLADPNYVKAKAVLDDVAGFDAPFFDISPREAEILDPQHRLFLECAWTAVEAAGYDPQRYQGLMGVYAGVGVNGYLLHHLAQRQDLLRTVGLYPLFIANDKDFLPSRVAYKLNLTGAAVAVQTACSTSLVAVHLACQSLLNGETDMALAGGVSIAIPQGTGYLYQEGMILAPDGHCRAFDAQAKGTVVGSGVGVVLLKRLEDAIADGDPCHAVIRGSAINNDGALKVGYTAPSVAGQAAVINEALAVANVDADTIGYIEAHGTGTELGDPIEIAALNRVFRRQTEQPEKPTCAIGSLKTNVGHLDTAAGVAGLIKTALALKHQAIPPSLNFETPNPNIDFAQGPFYVNTKLQDWLRSDALQPRRAGVSSFGIGGTNAHVILEEAPPLEPSGPARPWQLLLLSAKTPSALAQMTNNLADFFQEQSTTELNLADVAYTLSCGRQAFNYRRILVCQDIDQAIQALRAVAENAEEMLALPSGPQVVTGSGKPQGKSLTFLFPGQGSQHVNMGRDLYQTEPIFREQIDRCADLLQPLLKLDLRQILYPAPEQEATAAAQLQQTAIAQPALFVIEYALAQLWLAWGLKPTAMVGHSIGEYVAACLAGVFSLEAGLALVAKRGQLMQQLSPGAMVAVPLAVETLQSLLDKDSRFKEIAIAVINEPNRCVVSGPKTAISAFEQYITSQDTEGRRLHTSHAFHSPMMEPILDAFRQQCQQVDFQPPQRPYLSNLTGTWITTAQATDPNYWVQHLRQPVQFSQALTQLCQDADPPHTLLEVGPSRALSSLVQRHPAGQGQAVIATLRHPREDKSDMATLLSALGKLWLQGTEIDWLAVYGHERRHRLALPTYPFEHQRYWIEASDAPMGTSGSLAAQSNQSQGLHRREFKDWFYVPSWSRRPIPPVKRETQTVTDTILVFVDDLNVATPLIKQLGRNDRTIIQVQIGETFQSLGENHYSLNPQQREDYDHLLQALQRLEQQPDKILHLWTLVPQVSEPVQSTDQSLVLGFYGLLFLAQAWNKQEFDHSCDLVVITQHLQRVTGEEHLLPNQATLWGAIRTIPQEIAGLTCRCVDILLPDSASQPDLDLEPSSNLIHQLVTEMEAPAGEPENQAIAYRGPYRWVQQFQSFPMELENQGETLLRPEGVYLITGGLGGLGLTIAQHLAQHWQARLVLMSRSFFPQESDWQDWLENHPSDHPISLKIIALQALKEAGAEILVVTANVCDRTALQQAITKAIQQFGPIHGVIHAAGIPGGGVIDLRTQAETIAVFQPKLQGTLTLDQTLQDLNDRPLDFMVLCSSVTAITGAVGQIDYCAANAFLDAYAQARNVNSPTRYLAINWESLQQVGMAAKAMETLSERLAGDPSNHWLLNQMRSELALGLFPTDCGQVLEQLLGQSEPQVIVSTRELNARLTTQRRMGDSPEHHQPTANPSIKFPMVNVSDDPVENKIIGILQALLGRDTIGIHDNFFEMGGDSLIGMQFLTHLRQTFAIDLSITTLFEATTIAQLATVVKAKQPSAMASSSTADLDQLEDILNQVDTLSEEELNALSQP